MTKGPTGVLLAVVLTTALTLAVAASGHNTKIKTEVESTITSGPLSDFHVSGNVLSERKACRVPRKVRLYGFENPKERGNSSTRARPRTMASSCSPGTSSLTPARG